MLVTGLKYSRYNSWIKIQHFYTYNRWFVAANSLGKHLQHLHTLKKNQKTKNKTVPEIILPWHLLFLLLPELPGQPLISLPCKQIQRIKKWSSDKSPHQLTSARCAIHSSSYIDLFKNMKFLCVYLQTVVL